MIKLIASILLLIISIYLSLKNKLFNLNIIKILKEVFKNNKSFKTLYLSLAGKVGIGCIIGVITTIYENNSGCIFWIIFSIIVSSSIVYYETYLGIKYKDNDKSGAVYYISNGLNNKFISIIYLFVFIFSYLFGYITLQSNTISNIINNYFNISNILIGLILSIICFIIILGGSMTITKVSNILVPLMVIFYILLTIYVITNNNIYSVIDDVIYNAFNINSFKSFIISIISGVQIGIFSSETALGTTSISAGLSDNDAVTEGYVQIFGNFITLIIMLCTSIIVLTTNYSLIDLACNNFIDVAFYSFNYHFGIFGNIFLIIIIILFAFSSIISIYYFIESTLKYLTLNNKVIFLLKVITALIVLVSAVVSSTILWNITYILISILLIINTISIFGLRNNVRH